MDDLDDIDKLEEYVGLSAAFSIFLSEGYFLSRKRLECRL